MSIRGGVKSQDGRSLVFTRGQSGGELKGQDWRPSKIKEGRQAEKMKEKEEAAKRREQAKEGLATAPASGILRASGSDVTKVLKFAEQVETKDIEMARDAEPRKLKKKAAKSKTAGQ